MAVKVTFDKRVEAELLKDSDISLTVISADVEAARDAVLSVYKQLRPLGMYGEGPKRLDSPVMFEDRLAFSLDTAGLADEEVQSIGGRLRLALEQAGVQCRVCITKPSARWDEFTMLAPAITLHIARPLDFDRRNPQDHEPLASLLPIIEEIFGTDEPVGMVTSARMFEYHWERLVSAAAPGVEEFCSAYIGTGPHKLGYVETDDGNGQVTVAGPALLDDAVACEVAEAMRQTVATFEITPSSTAIIGRHKARAAHIGSQRDNPHHADWRKRYHEVLVSAGWSTTMGPELFERAQPTLATHTDVTTREMPNGNTEVTIGTFNEWMTWRHDPVSVFLRAEEAFGPTIERNPTHNPEFNTNFWT